MEEGGGEQLIAILEGTGKQSWATDEVEADRHLDDVEVATVEEEVAMAEEEAAATVEEEAATVEEEAATVAAVATVEEEVEEGEGEDRTPAIKTPLSTFVTSLIKSAKRSFGMNSASTGKSRTFTSFATFIPNAARECAL